MNSAEMMKLGLKKQRAVFTKYPAREIFILQGW